MAAANLNPRAPAMARNVWFKSTARSYVLVRVPVTASERAAAAARQAAATVRGDA